MTGLVRRTVVKDLMGLPDRTDILEPLDAARASCERAPLSTGAGRPAPGSRDGLKSSLLVLLLLAAATAAAHGWALWDGIFLDDHLHRLRLQDNHWSIQAMLEATTVKPDEFIDTWWQEKPIEWRYTRPFAMLAAKVVYHLTFGSVKALHAFSILLHLATAFMIYLLCMQMTRRHGWSVVAGLLFVVYSHSVYAVAWLASQNSVLQTTLTLGALLAYTKASRLNLYAGPRPDPGLSGADCPPVAAGLSPGWFALTLVVWCLGLLSRENAIVLPVLAASMDLAFGGWPRVRRRLGAYAVMGVIAGVFVFWRLVALYCPMPEWYVRRPDGPAYICWWIAKFMHYLTAAVWLSPMTIGPTGRGNPFVEVPWDCVLMLAILAVMGTGYWFATRRARGFWIWPLWMVLAILPVVPIMAAPHSGYMAGVGFSIAMVLGAALREKLLPTSIGRWCTGVAIWFLIATATYIPIYRTMWYSVNAAERLTVASIEASPPPPAARDLFFINLPFVNIYAQLHLNEQLPVWKTGGFEGAGRQASPALATVARPQTIYPGPILPNTPRVHVLTYSPNLLRMEQECVLEQLDAHAFRLAIVGGRPYFSGALGCYLIESMRKGGRLRTGDRVPGPLFDVQVTAADEDGTRELVFRFHEPLASPGYCFYLTTNQHGAARVKFWGTPPPATPTVVEPDSGGIAQALGDLRQGEASGGLALLGALQSSPASVSADARAAVTEAVSAIAAGLASPVGVIASAGDVRPEDWSRIRSWWEACVDDDHVQALWLQSRRFEGLRRTRDKLFRIREIASRVIRTDLYLTGPAFPSPP